MPMLISSFMNLIISSTVIYLSAAEILPLKPEWQLALAFLCTLLAFVTPTGLASFVSQFFLASALGFYVSVMVYFLFHGVEGGPSPLDGVDPAARTIAAVVAAVLYWAVTFLVLTYLRGGIFRIWRALRRHTAGNAAATAEQKWLLTTSAFYAQTNGYALDKSPSRFFLLNMGHNSLADCKSCRWAIKRDWGVVNKKSLDETLTNLLNTGHRVELKRLLAEALKDDAEVGNSSSPEPIPNLLGWDMLRYGNLVRMAYAAGYIDAEAAWRYLEKTRALIRAEVTSWEELVNGWLLGFRLWSNDENWANDYLKVCNRLMSDTRSPYLAVPFRT